MNANSSTVSERIYTAIRNDILNKTLVSGEKLTIKKLHEMYGVSSSPIREALFRLQQDGLIEYRSNAGMRVIEFTRQDLAEIYMLLTEFDVIALRAATTPTRRLSTLAALELCMERAGLPLKTITGIITAMPSTAFCTKKRRTAGSPMRLGRFASSPPSSQISTKLKKKTVGKF